MRALLDVNVLIALLDQDHALHVRARGWFAKNANAGWASCPLTQNGCVRILSHPGYPNGVSVAGAMTLLGEAIADSHHAFWADDFSLLDARIADPTRIHGPRQLTDVYLLALAVRNGGRFVTLDEGVSIAAVHGAVKKNLLIL